MEGIATTYYLVYDVNERMALAGTYSDMPVKDIPVEDLPEGTISHVTGRIRPPQRSLEQQAAVEYHKESHPKPKRALECEIISLSGPPRLTIPTRHLDAVLAAYRRQPLV